MGGDLMPTYRNDTNSAYVVRESSGLQKTVQPGESVQTYQILGAGWSKTADAPYLPLTNFRQSVASPGNVAGLLASKVITLVSDASGVVAIPNHASNPYGYQLSAGQAVEIDNDGEIDTLYFTGAGTVLVQGQP